MTATIATHRTYEPAVASAKTIAPTAPSASPSTDRVPTLDDLRSLVREVAADVAVREGTAAADARADLLVEALAPIVRLPEAGSAQAQHRSTVTLRELAVLQRWLARTPAVATTEVVRSMARIRSGLATG